MNVIENETFGWGKGDVRKILCEAKDEDVVK